MFSKDSNAIDARLDELVDEMKILKSIQALILMKTESNPVINNVIFKIMNYFQSIQLLQTHLLEKH